MSVWGRMRTLIWFMMLCASAITVWASPPAELVLQPVEAIRSSKQYKYIYSSDIIKSSNLRQISKSNVKKGSDFWTSRERPKSALYLRLKIVKGGTLWVLWNSSWWQNMKKNQLNSVTVSKNVKGGPFGLCETPAGCKIWKKLKGDPLRTEKNCPKKI